jgi:hypothetical protein
VGLSGRGQPPSARQFLTAFTLRFFAAGEVGKLEALDNDEPKNGPPFKFEIDPRAPPAIKTKFSVQQGATAGDYFLYTKVKFDREEQKVYEIPIQVRVKRFVNSLYVYCVE